MTPSPSPGDNKARAAVLVLLAIGLASTQDAIIKAMSGTYPVYETMLIRGLTSLPILGVWLAYTHGLRTLLTPLWLRILIRALILCTAYLAFILAIAAMPIANMVAIYFTMPFFVAGLAGPFLGERVPYYRWIAIVAGFAGVIVMVRPGVQAFEPAALLALYSAFGYAIGQMMGRDLAQRVEPLVIANWQNAVYFIFAGVIGVIAQASGFAGESHKSLAFLTRPFVWPTLPDFLLLSAVGVLAAFAMMSFISAYKLAESNFVAPFEYSGMIWAVLFGLLFFNDFPDFWTWSGMAVVASAGLFMLFMDRRARFQTG
ncbi:MAG: DMT family transporter [Rhizobiales bacterium]|jgi:drug/metabolite transporter (DMT)-like permease|nr:DMT family transporter [Hyphomicrobiales bacterium]MBP9173169.1 DMT family transporter [Hyphomicrobiales bacterium]